MNHEQIVKQIIDCFEGGNKLLIFGCGGSATMSNHMAAEFVGKIKTARKALPAISLASNNAILTAIPNDFGFEYVFSRQIEALGQSGDIAIAVSTSGKSQSVRNGCVTARKMGLIVIDFPRRGRNVCLVQEYQLGLMHRICVDVENYFI